MSSILPPRVRARTLELLQVEEMAHLERLRAELKAEEEKLLRMEVPGGSARRCAASIESLKKLVQSAEERVAKHTPKDMEVDAAGAAGGAKEEAEGSGSSSDSSSGEEEKGKGSKGEEGKGCKEEEGGDEGERREEEGSMGRKEQEGKSVNVRGSPRRGRHSSRKRWAGAGVPSTLRDVSGGSAGRAGGP